MLYYKCKLFTVNYENVKDHILANTEISCERQFLNMKC